MSARVAESRRWLPLLAAVAVAVAWRGGYGQDARSVVVALAGLAAIVALGSVPAAAVRASRTPLVWTLAGLAALTALSAAWTIGTPAEAVRNGAAILALAAVIVAAATLRAPWAHAGVLLAAALGAALVGLVAAVATAEPTALEICGTWRPAGPFEYPPTLGLVCAGALPAALALGTEHRRPVSVAGAVAGWLLATTIALTANRTGIALAGAVLVATVWLAPRVRTVAPLALGVIGSAAVSALVVGGDLGGAGAGRLMLAVLPVLPLCFLAARRSPASGTRRGRWIAVVALAALAATAAGVIADRGGGCGGDATHGRLGIWRASIATAAERPLEGYGSGTFPAASRDHQLEERPRPTRYAHNLALEAWVELGVAGLLLVISWYAAVAWLLLRSVRVGGGAYLLAPYAAAFPLANLLDWPWHLLGAGMLWAVAAGGLLASRRSSSSVRPW
jgi:hypothetical protein